MTYGKLIVAIEIKIIIPKAPNLAQNQKKITIKGENNKESCKRERIPTSGGEISSLFEIKIARKSDILALAVTYKVLVSKIRKLSVMRLKSIKKTDRKPTSRSINDKRVKR